MCLHVCACVCMRMCACGLLQLEAKRTEHRSGSCLWEGAPSEKRQQGGSGLGVPAKWVHLTPIYILGGVPGPGVSARSLARTRVRMLSASRPLARGAGAG